VEFGETGPLCRARFFAPGTPAQKPVQDILEDVAAYLRVSRQPMVKRLGRAALSLIGRLARETGILFRVTVLMALAGFALLAYQQNLLNKRLQQELRAADLQLDTVASDLIQAREDALTPGDLKAMQQRLESLEERSGFGARVVAGARPAVAFLQGTYGFREKAGGRMLRHAAGPDGMPLMTPRGRPLLTLEGEGPQVEMQFTGTGFFAGGAGQMVTNRHVALPWEESAAAMEFGGGLEPVMLRFLSYLPGEIEAVPVELVAASETSDLAVLQRTRGAFAPQGLAMARVLPSQGDEVIVMGYPAGLRSMVAQTGQAFIQSLEASEDADFWSLAERLAAEGFITPLASRGIVGRQTASAVVYDAETTHGGSGGPVLNVHGRVVAVNSAILPEFGGSNLGVPVAEVEKLLEMAAGL
jgi:S1-C subfamily serine protease